jgi:chemotaxis signal transduction protein
MSTLRTYPPEMPWAIVQVKNQLFAIATQDMREMLIMPETTQVPGVPAHIRGVINLRGRVLPVLDLRKRMGLASTLEETESFCALMAQREQDHRNWLNELEMSVNQRRPFTLATDPHKCKFGQWYDSYQAENPWVRALLNKFEAPHRQIHGIAVAIEDLKARQEFDKAQETVGTARAGVLAKLIALFGALRDLIRQTQRETAVVLAGEKCWFAITVDLALSVEKFAPENMEAVPEAVATGHHGVVERLTKRAKTKDVVLIVETDRLMRGSGLDAGVPN